MPSKVEVMWLMKKLTPDFKTIADFRKDNIDCMKGVFREFVKLCVRLDLYGAKCIAVDGNKFKAVTVLTATSTAKTRLQNERDRQTSIKVLSRG